MTILGETATTDCSKTWK